MARPKVLLTNPMDPSGDCIIAEVADVVIAPDQLQHAPPPVSEPHTAGKADAVRIGQRLRHAVLMVMQVHGPPPG